MATPEAKVKLKVKVILAMYNVYWHCPVQNGMGAPSLDFICCCKGRYFAIETKAGNKRPTERQQTTIDSIQQAGGNVFVVNEVEGMDHLQEWLKTITGE
jgi:hypothetical protein